MQSLLTTVLGWMLAVAIYYATAVVVNGMMSDQLEAGLSGTRSARIEPSEGLREI